MIILCVFLRHSNHCYDNDYYVKFIDIFVATLVGMIESGYNTDCISITTSNDYFYILFKIFWCSPWCNTRVDIILKYFSVMSSIMLKILYVSKIFFAVFNLISISFQSIPLAYMFSQYHGDLKKHVCCSWRHFFIVIEK